MRDYFSLTTQAHVSLSLTNEGTFLLCNSWCVLKIMTLKVRSPNTYLPGPKKPINIHVAEVFTTTLHTISNDNLKVGTWLFLFCPPFSSPARQHFFSSSSSFLPLPLAPQASFNFLIFLLFSSGHSHLIVSFIFLTLSSQLCLSSSSFVYPFELFRVLQASPGKQFLQFCFLQFFSFPQCIFFLFLAWFLLFHVHLVAIWIVAVEFLDLLHFLILFKEKFLFFLSKKFCLLDWFAKKSYPNLLLILCVVDFWLCGSVFKSFCGIVFSPQPSLFISSL